MNWRRDVEAMPRDGRWVFILDEFGSPAVVYWIDDFGWCYDGGDHYTPVAWAECLGLQGEILRR